jgi:hypothetical protein
MICLGSRFYVKATATFVEEKGNISVSANARESEEKKGMDSAQITGATSSYARKYALGGLLLLDDVADADANEIKGLTDAQIKSSIEKGTQKAVLDGNGTKWVLTEAQVKALQS